MCLTSYDIEPGWGPIEANLVTEASIGQRTNWAWTVLDRGRRGAGAPY